MTEDDQSCTAPKVRIDLKRDRLLDDFVVDKKNPGEKSITLANRIGRMLHRAGYKGDEGPYGDAAAFEDELSLKLLRSKR